MNGFGCTPPEILIAFNRPRFRKVESVSSCLYTVCTMALVGIFKNFGINIELILV